jgi:hypothetical protein
MRVWKGQVIGVIVGRLDVRSSCGQLATSDGDAAGSRRREANLSD